MEIESQIAFDSNNLSFFREKWHGLPLNTALGRNGLPLNNARQKNNLIDTVS